MAADREYFFTIDASGRLYHDGTELSDEHFLEFFYRRLGPNNSGRHPGFPFLSPCGHEFNFVRCADRPLLFRRLIEGRLTYAPGLSVEYEPQSLRFTEGGGRLLHPAPVGEYAPLSSELTLQLGRDLIEWGPYYAVRSDGREEVIEPLHPPAGHRVLRPRDDNQCFGCGGAHKDGLRLSFLYDSLSRSSRTFLTPGDFFQGAPGWMHGGFIALLLDEAMGKVLSGLGIRAPTANLRVDYRRPVELGHRIEVRAELAGIEGRKYTIRAAVVSAEEQGQHSVRPEGQSQRRPARLAEGSGLFVVPKAAQ